MGEAVLDWRGDPVADALALRLAGALHALALTERTADLANVYPPQAEAGDDQLWQAVSSSLDREAATVLRFIESPPQTNEVARSAALAGGFLTIAAITSLPLSLLEIGASAGLNLHWDLFGYDLGGLGVNRDQGRPLLAPDWEGPPPPAAEVIVRQRAGCDRAPIDIGSTDAVLRLRAYIWPDQTERLARLDQALAAVGRSSVRVAGADAADWAAARLAERRVGTTSVLYHSIVWQYLAPEGKLRLERAIGRAGRQADSDTPFAWLRMEPESSKAAALRLDLWPNRQSIHLADVDYHGRWIRWLVSPQSLR